MKARFALVTTVGVIALLGMGAGLVHHRSQSSWHAMERSVTELKSARSRVEHRRVPLWGEETSDPAHVHYDEAVALAAGLPADAEDELMAVLQEGDRALHPGDEQRKRWLPILAAMSRGAHAVDATEVLTVPAKQSGAPDLRVCRQVALAAVLQARELRQAGHGTEAVQVLLDAATFGNDLGRRGSLIQQMIGNAITAIATGDAWPTLALAELDAQSLDLLAAGLARLDERMRVTVSFDEDLILLAANWREATGQGEDYSAAAWRYGFSTRWMMADAFHQVGGLMHRLERPTKSWSGRQAVLDHEFRGIARSTNPIVAIVCPPTLVSAERGLREALTQVRLLRIAIELHSGRTPTQLDDPLGRGPLLVEKAGSNYSVVSAGERRGKPLERQVQMLVLDHEKGKKGQRDK